MEESNNIQESNCTSGNTGSSYGSRLAAYDDDDCVTPSSGTAGLISVGTFLLIFVILICWMNLVRPRGPTKRQKQDRVRYIDERLIQKRVEKKDNNVSTVDTDKTIMLEMEEGTKSSEPRLDHRFQTQGSKVYVSFCEDDMMDSIHGDLEGSETNKQQSHASIPPCVICKEHYLEKDMICWPKSEQCNHAFHVECIKPWLMHHAKCPVCRKNYLCPQDGDDAENQRIASDGISDQTSEQSISERSAPESSPASLAQRIIDKNGMSSRGKKKQTIPGSEPIPERFVPESTASLAQILEGMYEIQAESDEFNGGVSRSQRSIPTVRVRTHR